MSLITKDGSEIYINFNQTNTYCCFGTDIGFYVYQIAPFKKVISRKIEGGVSMIKMLHESNIFIFVGRTDTGPYPNHKLIIWDDQKKEVLGEISYNCRIRNINITKKYVIVLSQNKLYIYDFQTLVLQKSINVQGEQELISIGLEDSDYIIYPGEDIGTINITKLSSDYLKTIKAHKNMIENLYLSNNGKYIVSASERGTLIRIFDIETGEQLQELRRGYDPTKINNIRMSEDNAILLVSSIKGTIHLYNTNITENCEEQNVVWDSYGMSYFKTILPKYFGSQWSFSQIYLNSIVTYSILDSTNKTVYSFGNDGQFYEINYDNHESPVIEKNIKYISEENDPFSERSTTIR
tara:strand:- start:588 stop:1640 length:1053 start_codon:yes stop_codon:yes gene_type:complete